MNQPIADFVREALLRGVSREEIARALDKGGWSAKEIQSALEAFVETELPVPVPRKRVSSSPKEAFFSWCSSRPSIPRPLRSARWFLTSST